MGQPLFDKTYDELREAFVRARFTEPNIFGREDIEVWHSSPTSGTIPFNRAPEFLRHFGRIWKGTDLSLVLRSNATPLAKPPEWHLFRMENKGGDPDAYVAIIRALQIGGAHVYYPWTNCVGIPPILLVDNDVYVIDSPYEQFQPILSLRRAGVSTVLEVLNGEISHNRPKASEARELFRTEAGNAITAARESAQRDFDEAVAVSADGTKIVKADVVIVILDENRVVVYPAEAFLTNKILRSPNTSRIILRNIDTRMDSIDEYVRWILQVDAMRRPLNDWQCLDLCKYFDDRSRLLTQARFCPSPLPDGGREIRV